MKVSGFTFIKNGQILGYPFIQSIQSILPIADEFAVNVGFGEDATLELVNSIKSKKIRVIQSEWNENMTYKGFVYGQQKMIAQYSCTGDWLFYIEGDEIYHEQDIKNIRALMNEHLKNPKIEAMAFDFIHFYGNGKSYLDSPGWYRSEVRAIKSSVRSYAPDGLFWVVLDKSRVGRYPNAISTNIPCYHYGWVRSQEEMNLKSKKVQKYWNKKYKRIDYSQMDQNIIREFSGDHPQIIKDWLPNDKEVFKADVNYRPSSKQIKHRWIKKIEIIFGVDLSRKHYKKVK